MRFKLRPNGEGLERITGERIAEIEEGRGAPVTLEELQLIANTLGMPGWQLLRIAEEEETDEEERSRRKPDQN